MSGVVGVTHQVELLRRTKPVALLYVVQLAGEVDAEVLNDRRHRVVESQEWVADPMGALLIFRGLPVMELPTDVAAPGVPIWADLVDDRCPPGLLVPMDCVFYALEDRSDEPDNSFTASVESARRWLASVDEVAAHPFHETLMYLVSMLDRPAADPRSKPFAGPLSEDEFLLDRLVAVMSGGGEFWRARSEGVPVSGPLGRDAARAMLRVAGQRVGQNTEGWRTIFNPRSGSGGMWPGDPLADFEALSGPVADPRPTGPFHPISKQRWGDTKHLVSGRVFVPAFGGWEERIYLTRAHAKPECAAQILAMIDAEYNGAPPPIALGTILETHLISYWTHMVVHATAIGTARFDLSELIA
jgi:hypothetical protein